VSTYERNHAVVAPSLRVMYELGLDGLGQRETLWFVSFSWSKLRRVDARALFCFVRLCAVDGTLLRLLRCSLLARVGFLWSPMLWRRLLSLPVKPLGLFFRVARARLVEPPPAVVRVEEGKARAPCWCVKTSRARARGSFPRGGVRF